MKLQVTKYALQKKGPHFIAKPQSLEEQYVVDKVNKSLRRVTYELVTLSGEKVCHNTHILYRFLDGKKTTCSQFSVPGTLTIIIVRKASWYT